MLREELRKKWLKEQEALKGEEIEIVYSYWDGSGHRKSVSVSVRFGSLVVLEIDDHPSLTDIIAEPPMYDSTGDVHSARRATKSVPSWRSADSSSLNSAVSAWTISCI